MVAGSVLEVLAAHPGANDAGAPQSSAVLQRAKVREIQVSELILILSLPPL